MGVQKFKVQVPHTMHYHHIRNKRTQMHLKVTKVEVQKVQVLHPSSVINDRKPFVCTIRGGKSISVLQSPLFPLGGLKAPNSAGYCRKLWTLFHLVNIFGFWTKKPFEDSGKLFIIVYRFLTFYAQNSYR